MELSLAWLTRPLVHVVNKLIAIDKSYIPKVSIVGSSDKNKSKDMKVVRLTFKPSHASLLIQNIYSSEKIFSAESTTFIDNSPSFYFVGVNFIGDSEKPFNIKNKVIYSDKDEEILFSVIDTNKPIKITIRYSFLKRYSFFI